MFYRIRKPSSLESRYRKEGQKAARPFLSCVTLVPTPSKASPGWGKQWVSRISGLGDGLGGHWSAPKQEFQMA